MDLGLEAALLAMVLGPGIEIRDFCMCVEAGGS